MYVIIFKEFGSPRRIVVLLLNETYSGGNFGSSLCELCFLVVNLFGVSVEKNSSA
jgi:hypothetical protein